MTQRSGWPVALALLVAGTVTSAGSALAQSKGPTSGDQASGYESTCAPCHGNPATRAPTRESLHAMSPDFIVSALTDGLMKDMGAGLSLQQRVALAEFLTDRKVGKQTPMAGHCVSPQPPLLASGAAFNGWGVTVANPRYQPEPGLSAADLPKLKMAWAFGVPGVVAMFGQPTIAGGRVFFGSQNGHVYSLDARTGCYYWDYQASAGVRTAITIARIGNRDVALFGDRRGHAYSVDAATGETVWKVTVVEGPHLGLPVRPLCSKASSTSRSTAAMTARPSTRSTNAARAAARSPPSMRNPARSSGKPTPSLTPRRKGRTPLAHSFGVPLALRSGHPRRSIRSSASSTSAPAITIPLRLRI